MSIMEVVGVALAVVALGITIAMYLEFVHKS